jgi:hypothetical protein
LKLEWQPEQDSPLLPFQTIPQQVRKELLIPYPFEENSSDYVLLSDSVVNFQNQSSIYVFGLVDDDKIIIRHYSMINKEKYNLSLYAELQNGKYICRFYFDENENMLFGKLTICGYSDLGYLHSRIYSFDENKYIKFLVDNSLGYDNERLKQDHIKQSKLYGFGDIEDDDMEDFIRYGMSTEQFDDHKDIYGGY